MVNYKNLIDSINNSFIVIFEKNNLIQMKKILFPFLLLIHFFIYSQEFSIINAIDAISQNQTEKETLNTFNKFTKVKEIKEGFTIISLGSNKFITKRLDKNNEIVEIVFRNNSTKLTDIQYLTLNNTYFNNIKNDIINISDKIENPQLSELYKKHFEYNNEIYLNKNKNIIFFIFDYSGTYQILIQCFPECVFEN